MFLFLATARACRVCVCDCLHVFRSSDRETGEKTENVKWNLSPELLFSTVMSSKSGLRNRVQAELYLAFVIFCNFSLIFEQAIERLITVNGVQSLLIYFGGQKNQKEFTKSLDREVP